MGVSIYPFGGTIVTDLDAYEALHALEESKNNFFEVLAQSIIESRNINKEGNLEELSNAEELIVNAYAEKDHEKRYEYIEDLRMANEGFPHWSGDLKWDGTEDSITQFPMMLIIKDKPSNAPDYDFSMSYSGYNRFREIISEAIIGVLPQEVWANPNKYEKNYLTLLVNGSDCEGIIESSVVKKISIALNAPESFDKIKETLAKIYPNDEYTSTSMLERYGYFAEMFKATAETGYNIMFS